MHNCTLHWVAKILKVEIRSSLGCSPQNYVRLKQFVFKLYVAKSKLDFALQENLMSEIIKHISTTLSSSIHQTVTKTLIQCGVYEKSLKFSHFISVNLYIKSKNILCVSFNLQSYVLMPGIVYYSMYSTYFLSEHYIFIGRYNCCWSKIRTRIEKNQLWNTWYWANKEERNLFGFAGNLVYLCILR